MRNIIKTILDNLNVKVNNDLLDIDYSGENRRKKNPSKKKYNNNKKTSKKYSKK